LFPGLALLPVSAPAAILSKPFQKKFEGETVQQEAVKLGPHLEENS